MIIILVFILWCLSIGFTLTFGILFIREYREEKMEFALLMSLFYIFLAIGRVFHVIIDFSIGYPYSTLSYTGILLCLQMCYAIPSFIALFMLYFAIERKIEKNTHYILSIFVVITAILTITNYLLPHEISLPFFTFGIVYPIWLFTLLALPLLYLNIALKSEGRVRKNAIIAMIGMLAYEFGIGFSSPEALPVVLALGVDLITIIAPILQIIGAILVYYVFTSRM